MSEKQKQADDCDDCDDPTHHHHDHAFTPSLCRLTVNLIRKSKPYPLDDELAKKYGVDTFDHLKERVKTNLEKNAEEEKKNQERFAMELEILKNYHFDMPASLVATEMQGAKQAIFNHLRSQGVGESEIVAKVKEMEHETAMKYDRDFRLYFLTQQYAKEHKLDVSQDELMMETMRQMMLERTGKSPVNSSLDQKERMTHLKMQLLAVKAIDQMIEKAEKA